MFGTRKKPSFPPFVHADDCRILKADPTTEIEWSETRTGFWEARCQCGVQHYQEPPSDERARLDPLDPKNAQHGPTCEYKDTTDPTLIKAILTVRDGAADTGAGYWWVSCSSCSFSWQVPHHPYVQKPMGPPKAWEFPKLSR